MASVLYLAISQTGAETAKRMAAIRTGEVTGLAGRVDGCDTVFDDTGAALRNAFAAGRPVVAVMASGAVIRILAPLLTDKTKEPPVIAASEDGANIVPLLGGHRGANELARELATGLGGQAAVTTAGDTRFGVALDEPPPGYVLANPQAARPIMAALLAGEKARLEGEAGWLEASRLPFSSDGKVRLTVTDRAVEPEPLQLVYHPKTLVLGMGCERGVDANETISLAEQTIADSGFTVSALTAVASVDLKSDEAAIHAVAAHFGVSARFFAPKRLEKEAPRLATPSEVVFAETGCHGVAEGAALALAGADGELVVAKDKSARATAAVARAPRPILLSGGPEQGKSRGRLFVVGIGPGQDDWRSPEATRMIEAANDLVGYSLYLDLIAGISHGKTRHDYDLGREEDRVRHAVELAGEGRNVALVCSGDAGIYAMAALVFELLERGGLSEAARRIAIEVSPGISALQAAAARAGAPLGHDFCTISLSDLLTPWQVIQQRVTAAAEGDFVIAFYNPVSRRRRTQLAWARNRLLEHRPAETPVILAANLGRQGETLRIVPLCELKVDDVDMLTVVVVGSSNSRTVSTGDGRTWVYTPRGYAAKDGTGIVEKTKVAE